MEVLHLFLPLMTSGYVRNSWWLFTCLGCSISQCSGKSSVAESSYRGMFGPDRLLLRLWFANWLASKMEELPRAVFDMKLSSRCHPGSSSHESSQDLPWFARNAVNQMKQGGSVDSTVGLSLVARQQSKDLLGRSLGLSFSSVYACLCEWQSRFMDTKILRVTAVLTVFTAAAPLFCFWHTANTQMNSPPPHIASNPAVPPSLPAHTCIAYMYTHSLTHVISVWLYFFITSSPLSIFLYLKSLSSIVYAPFVIFTSRCCSVCCCSVETTLKCRARCPTMWPTPPPPLCCTDKHTKYSVA